MNIEVTQGNCYARNNSKNRSRKGGRVLGKLWLLWYMKSIWRYIPRIFPVWNRLHYCVCQLSNYIVDMTTTRKCALYYKGVIYTPFSIHEGSFIFCESGDLYQVHTWTSMRHYKVYVDSFRKSIHGTKIIIKGQSHSQLIHKCDLAPRTLWSSTIISRVSYQTVKLISRILTPRNISQFLKKSFRSLVVWIYKLQA